MSRRKAVRIQYGNKGVELRITLRNEEGDRLDLTNSFLTADSSRVILIQKPSGTGAEKPGVLVGAATEGTLRAVFSAGDLNELGLYKIQAWVTTPTTTYSTEVGYFEVVPNVGIPA